MDTYMDRDPMQRCDDSMNAAAAGAAITEVFAFEIGAAEEEEAALRQQAEVHKHFSSSSSSSGIGLSSALQQP
jgi:hypothetical protein